MRENFDFMRSLSTRSILDKNDKEKLAPHVLVVVEKLRAKGADPIEAFTRCKDYLEDRVFVMERDVDKNDFRRKNKNPKRAGTLAWLLYMKYNLSTIIQILAMERINKLFGE